jgi:hypothetical protein
MSFSTDNRGLPVPGRCSRRRRLGAILTCMLLAAAGCLPSAEQVRSDIKEGRSDGAAVGPAPWFRQNGPQCGPAVLACLLAFYGHTATVDEISSRILNTRRHATSTSAMGAESLRHHLWTQWRFNADMDIVRGWLRRGVPVVALLTLRGEADGHYVLVTACDDTRRVLLLHDTLRGPDRVWPYNEFMEAWRGGDHWCMAAFDPRREVAGLSPDEAYEAGKHAEAAGWPEHAERWYRTAGKHVGGCARLARLLRRRGTDLARAEADRLERRALSAAPADPDVALAWVERIERENPEAAAAAAKVRAALADRSQTPDRAGLAALAEMYDQAHQERAAAEVRKDMENADEKPPVVSGQLKIEK